MGCCLCRGDPLSHTFVTQLPSQALPTSQKSDILQLFYPTALLCGQDTYYGIYTHYHVSVTGWKRSHRVCATSVHGLGAS